MKKRLFTVLSSFLIVFMMIFLSETSLASEEGAWVMVREEYRVGSDWESSPLGEVRLSNGVSFQGENRYEIHEKSDGRNPDYPSRDMHVIYSWSSPPSIIQANERILIELEQEVISNVTGGLFTYYRSAVEAGRNVPFYISGLEDKTTVMLGSWTQNTFQDHHYEAQGTMTTNFHRNFWGPGRVGDERWIEITLGPARFGQSNVRYTYEWKDTEALDPQRPELTEDILEQASDWAVDEIREAHRNNLTTEKVLGNFSKAITREEFCELAVKLYEALSGESADIPSLNPFNDTNNPYILKANALGIVNGVSETRFAPNDNVTREQIAVMFYRSFKAVGLDPDIFDEYYPVYFRDRDNISYWAIREVAFINHFEIMRGIGDNTLNPKGQATREQAIALVLRSFNTWN